MKKGIFLVILVIAFNAIFSFSVYSQGKISGLMFGDYFYNVVRDTGINSLPNVANGGKKDLNGFQLRRIYFTYDYDISNSFTTRFRLEVDQSANTSNGKIGVFVKDAYLQWKNIFKGSDLLFGISPTPAYEVSESVWGNRFLEKTIMDLRGIVSSRDLAVALKGKIDSVGRFKYWLMIGDGTGNKPETDKYKRFYAHIQYTPIKQFTATLYADLKAKPNINDPTSNTIPPATVANNDLTCAIFLGYKENDAYTFGVEGFLNLIQNGMVKNGALNDKTGIGISTFASYNVSKKFEVVGRYDYFDPNSDTDVKEDLRNWFIFSLNYKPNEKVTISPNVIIETYDKVSGKKINSGITPRITFYWKY